mgnify:CR=1 FL=1
MVTRQPNLNPYTVPHSVSQDELKNSSQAQNMGGIIISFLKDGIRYSIASIPPFRTAKRKSPILVNKEFHATFFFLTLCLQSLVFT